MTSSGDDLNQKIRGSTTTTTATALCDDKKKNEHASVIGMLGDIQARVSFVFFHLPKILMFGLLSACMQASATTLSLSLERERVGPACKRILVGPTSHRCH